MTFVYNAMSRRCIVVKGKGQYTSDIDNKNRERVGVICERGRTVQTGLKCEIVDPKRTQ